MTIIKYLSILWCLFIGSSAWSQQGQWYIGGNGGLHKTFITINEEKGENDFSWHFAPEIGKFITHRLQLGLGMNVSGYNNQSNPIYQDKMFRYGGSLSGRYFFRPSHSLKPFVRLNLYVNNGEIKITAGSQAERIVNQFALGASLQSGISMTVHPNWMILGSVTVLGISSTIDKNKAINEKKVINVVGLYTNNLGSRFSLGVIYTLPKKKEEIGQR